MPAPTATTTSADTSDVSVDVSAVLAVGAGIVALLNFYSRPSISIRGMNERLTIRNWHFEIFRWLPIGRCEVRHGSGHSGLAGKTAGRDGDHKRQYRGNPDEQRPELKEDARSSALAEKDLTFYVKRFLVTAPGLIFTKTNSHVTRTR